MMIKIENLTKQLENKWVLKNINLVILPGKFTVIIGQSGVGKSILLKIIIGLMKPTTGSIFYNQTNITQFTLDEEFDKHFKKIGYVFQFAALLDSLTVFENIAITLLEQGKPSSTILPIVEAMFRRINLNTDILHQYPSSLSGGMKKMVAFLRTLLTNPSIIFSDELASGLDPVTKTITYSTMRSIQKERNLTIVAVSHDTDIFRYADNVALLHDGEIKFFGEAPTIWESDNPYIYQFIRGETIGPLCTNFPCTSSQ
ncbi:MAG: ATP-binding cassette domain-containing protein [Candidatus Babeliales bacterium]